MMVVYWPLIYTRDSLALFLGLELLGTSQCQAESTVPEGSYIFGNSLSTYILLQGLETLEFPPPSPSDLAPERAVSTVKAALKAGLYRNSGGWPETFPCHQPPVRRASQAPSSWSRKAQSLGGPFFSALHTSKYKFPYSSLPHFHLE